MSIKHFNGFILNEVAIKNYFRKPLSQLAQGFFKMIQIVWKIFIDPNNYSNLLFQTLKSSDSLSDTICFYSTLDMFAGFLIYEPY